MKKLLCFLMTMSCLWSCEVDNYDPPSSALNGRLVFEGVPVEIRQGINVLQLYQPGFDNFDPIRVNVTQDGSFSSMLFDGSYRMVRISGNGPWENESDSINVEVNGMTQIDIPVRPFFSLSNSEFSVSEGELQASCVVRKNSDDRVLEEVVLLVGKTMLLDHIYRLTPSSAGSIRAGAEVTEGETILLSQNLEAFGAEAHLFARIGVKTVGHPELIYSPIWRIR